METKFTPEILEQIKKAQTPEELQATLKEIGFEPAAEETQAFFEKLHKRGELTDEEMSKVSAGVGISSSFRGLLTGFTNTTKQ